MAEMDEQTKRKDLALMRLAEAVRGSLYREPSVISSDYEEMCRIAVGYLQAISLRRMGLRGDLDCIDAANDLLQQNSFSSIDQMLSREIQSTEEHLANLVFARKRITEAFVDVCQSLNGGSK